jgi:hypothetical protein
MEGEHNEVHVYFLREYVVDCFCIVLDALERSAYRDNTIVVGKDARKGAKADQSIRATREQARQNCAPSRGREPRLEVPHWRHRRICAAGFNDKTRFGAFPRLGRIHARAARSGFAEGPRCLTNSVSYPPRP